ncbi:MAG: type protein [Symbiobacteriaceae bacterium]|nr:type protein [Symbiobacteriaceae bacterium]
MTVRQVQASFFQNKGWGVYFPQTVTFSLSQNGVAWTTLGTVGTKTDLSATGSLFQKYTVDGFSYIGRYIKVEIPTNVWVFIDEIQAFGQPEITADAVKPQPSPAQPQPRLGFPRAGAQTGGASQQVLIYGGAYPADPSLITWTEAEFKPYVTYVDPSGSSRDWFYDSFLFIPLAKAASGRDYGPVANPSNKADWEAYLAHTFDASNQLAALDGTVATARQELNDHSHKAKVVITIPYASPLQANFGDVDGDGVTENFNHDLVGADQAAANRSKVSRWYVDQALARWNAAGYQNLELVGFYWYSETVRYNLSPVEEQVMSDVIRYVHDRGYKVNWIPAVQAEGFRRWQQIGFDQVNMQPNYAFHAVTVDRLQANADMADQYGMGIEMELDNRILQMNAAGAAARTKFLQYMDYGVKTGYMHAFSNWYQQVRTLSYAAKSPYPEVRQMYDLAYQWVKGTYKPSNHPGDGNGINDPIPGEPEGPGRTSQDSTEVPPLQ